jgi:glucokinase
MTKQKVALAIDLGGTNAKLGLISDDYQILREKSIPTEAKLGPENSVNKWAQILKEWQSEFEVDLVGIGSPGPLDSDKGIILNTPNLESWANFPLCALVTEKTGLPCFIENDANCAALGEWVFNKVPYFVMITLGTGVGSGVIDNGHLVRGVKGLAVEAGHMVIDRNGPVCGCGRTGDFEAWVGGRSLVNQYNEKSSNKIAELHSKDVFDRAKNKDPIAEELIENWILHLAVGIGNIINLFNPTQVILTGGLSAAFPEVESRFNKIFLHEAFKPSLNYCQIVVSQLQERAGIFGAALWARQQHERRTAVSKL